MMPCIEGLGDLDPPLVPELGNAKKSSTHNSDDDGGQKAKDTLPEIFSLREDVISETIESANHASAYDRHNQYTEPYSPPNLIRSSQPIGDLLPSAFVPTWLTSFLRTEASRCVGSVCLRKASNVDTIMLVSMHSRMHTKNTSAVPTCQHRF